MSTTVWQDKLTGALTAAMKRRDEYVTDYLKPMKRKFAYGWAARNGYECVKHGEPQVRRKSEYVCFDCKKRLHSIDWDEMAAYPCRCCDDTMQSTRLKDADKVYRDEACYQLRITRVAKQ